MSEHDFAVGDVVDFKGSGYKQWETATVLFAKDQYVVVETADDLVLINTNHKYLGHEIRPSQSEPEPDELVYWRARAEVLDNALKAMLKTFEGLSSQFTAEFDALEGKKK